MVYRHFVSKPEHLSDPEKQEDSASLRCLQLYTYFSSVFLSSSALASAKSLSPSSGCAGRWRRRNTSPASTSLSPCWRAVGVVTSAPFTAATQPAQGCSVTRVPFRVTELRSQEVRAGSQGCSVTRIPLRVTEQADHRGHRRSKS